MKRTSKHEEIDEDREPDEDEADSAAPRRTQLGELRDEVARLEKTSNIIRDRVRTLVDGNVPQTGPASVELKQLRAVSASPIRALTIRVRNVRLRLESQVLERLSRLGSE